MGQLGRAAASQLHVAGDAGRLSVKEQHDEVRRAIVGSCRCAALCAAHLQSNARVMADRHEHYGGFADEMIAAI